MEEGRTFVVFRWLGLFPFDAAGKFSLAQSIYSFTLMTFIISTYAVSFGCFYLQLHPLVGIFPGPLLSSVDIFQGLTSFLGYLVHYGLVIKSKYDFSNLMGFFSRVKSKKSCEFYILCTGIVLLGFSSIVSLKGKCNSILCALTISTDLGLLVQFVVLLQFLTFVQCLKYEFTAIKDSIEVDRHEQLVTVGGLINSLYGWQLLLFLLNFVANFILAAFNLLDEVHEYTYTRGFEQSRVISATIKIVFYLMELIYMCDVCSSTCFEAEAFNHELFRMMRSNDRLCNNKKLHLYVTMKQSIEFTACGFFRIGYPLVTSIIAAATTYLVIIIQFSLPDSSTH